MTDAAASTLEPAIGPWNPGVRSDLPSAFLPLITVYRPEHVETPFRDALELSDLCGLPARQLTRFRAGRLVAHEVLIRVMSDLSVPVGAVYADLGVNFRGHRQNHPARGHRAAPGRDRGQSDADPRRGRRGARPRDRRHPRGAPGRPPAGTGLVRPTSRPEPARHRGSARGSRDPGAAPSRNLAAPRGEAGDGMEIAACEACAAWCRVSSPGRTP
ncbi:hypothetical protein ACU4GR_23280 [Methylobacterium oryzae CBMB20]